MAKLSMNVQSLDVAEGIRLVEAIEKSGINIGHRCGGNAKCTTCRVTFNAGEPDTMTQAEFDKLGDNLGQFRLACQIVCNADMDVTVLMTKESAGWDDAGPAVTGDVTPEAVFHSIEALKAKG